MDISIVHLSDLHFRNDATNRYRLQRLKEDLLRIHSDGSIYTTFTGDLVQNGDEDAYNLLLDEFVMPLIENGHEILTVPGNHDIERSRTSIDFVSKCINDTGSGYLFDEDGRMLEHHPCPDHDPLVKYNAFAALFAPYDEFNYWGYSKTIGPVSFVGLNSTWLSAKRPQPETDLGRLRIEAHVLQKLLDSLPADTLKVALYHHPIEWLEETSRPQIKATLIENFDLALFGHVHSSDLSNLARADAGCIFMQSPPLRSDWSLGTNGYAIIRCNVPSKKFEVDYRSYSEPRRSFVVGEDFAAHGRSYPRKEDTEYFKSAPSEGSLIQRFLDAESFDFTDWYRSNIKAKSKNTSSFILPKARKIRAGSNDRWLEPAMSICDIVSGSLRDVFFLAPMDAGLSTGAYLTFKTLADDFRTHRKVPAFFDAGDQKINRASIVNAICRTSLVRYSHQEASRLAEDGAVTLVVDGLSLADIAQFNLFRKTIAKHFPKLRCIYFVSLDKRGKDSENTDDAQLYLDKDDVYEIVELEVADIREMVRLYHPTSREEASDSIVSQVLDSFRQMDEPIYASTVAVVVETLTQDPEFKPINKARLLERYVECLLGRFDIDDVREGTFTSGDKIDFLSFVARSLLESDSTGLDDSGWKELVSLYQNQYLIELPRNLLEEFTNKGILVAHQGNITFRGDYLFSFFVARQMKTDAEFAHTIFDGNKIFTYNKELVFYGDLEGTDTKAVLDSVYKKLGEIEEVLLENYSKEGITLTEEWINTCAESGEEDESIDALADAAESLNNAEPTQEAADRIGNAKLNEVARRRGVTKRLDVEAAEARLLVAMKMYGLLLKNALQVPANDKLRHLNKLLETAELWVGVLCAKRSQISISPVVIAGGIRFINIGALIDKEKSVRDFKYNAPQSISRILTESLRNPLLSVALRRLLNTTSPMSAMFIRDVLLDLPAEDNREAVIRSLGDENDLTLVTASVRTLRSRFLASGHSAEQRRHIEAIVKRLEREAQLPDSANFERLKKARLVRDLRESAHKRRSAGVTLASRKVAS